VLDRNVLSPREFNDWRALTAELLLRGKERNETEVQTQIRWVEELMEPWALTDLDDEKLSDILSDAIRLSQLLRLQRSCWSIKFPDVPVTDPDVSEIRARPYEPHTMSAQDFDDYRDDLKAPSKVPVEFVIFPMLYKRGTIEGEQFELDSLVKKAEVTLEPPKTGNSSE